ncbi:FecR family protein [Flavobacterium sp. GSA192]|uniref:FecR family protein n=1 Tax=Flavobacterium sp. GSA192 TaxID=2576304 RepID=UPI001128196E|nr:FecR family protein [Flavobacterium sp. GSA192]
MNSQEIEIIITKYFSQSANMDDLDVLNKWIESQENQEIFQEYVKTHFAVTLAMNDPDITAIKNELLKEIRKGKKKEPKYRIGILMRYAAIAILFLGIGFLMQKKFFINNNDKEVFVNSKNEITLQLENGEVQVITVGKKNKVTDSKGNVIGNQNGNKIIYDIKTPLNKLAYNTIKIPYGKRFELELSDGTLVHLNSGSTLKYPVAFIAGQNRQVFLDGEAFFDVSKDKKHPFVVNADNLNIRVLGTHFNVSNYAEDDVTDVVLVEGSVGMYPTNEKFDVSKNTILEPGFKGSFSKKDRRINTASVVTSTYTSWMQGGLTFRNMSFKNISKKLERHYNVSIETQNTKLENELFNASFKSNESIEKVLSYFNDVYGIKYNIKNDQILIK